MLYAVRNVHRDHKPKLLDEIRDAIRASGLSLEPFTYAVLTSNIELQKRSILKLEN